MLVEEIPAEPEALEGEGEGIEEIVFEALEAPVTAATVPGVYRDPVSPEVVYEFDADNQWVGTWQPDDETKGLRMEGVYMVEGDVVHLRVMSFARREPYLENDWDRRTPPHPRPRGFFRIDGNSLVLEPEQSAQAFRMAPFHSERLLKVAH